MDYREMYEKGRVEICKKFACQNCYENSLIADYQGILEYVIDDSVDYKKAQKIFSGSMNELVSMYNAIPKGSTEIFLSSLLFTRFLLTFQVIKLICCLI